MNLPQVRIILSATEQSVMSIFHLKLIAVCLCFGGAPSTAAPSSSIDVEVGKEDTHVTVDDTNNTDNIGIYVINNVGNKGWDNNSYSVDKQIIDKF